ncbi:MAG: MaoC family dehydratase, partial [Dehalococcoidia bacterium]
SGRVTLTFTLELLRRYFGSDVFNYSGMADMRFLRPARPGDTLTLTGKVAGIGKEANGSRVTVQVQVTNQNGDVTGAGSGSAIVPSGYLPSEE